MPKPPRAKFLDKSLVIYNGELKDNNGNEILPAGKEYDQQNIALEKMDWLIDGVKGSNGQLMSSSPLPNSPGSPGSPTPSGLSRAEAWRAPLESVLLPIGALLTALFIFGIFCAIAGANPFAVYASIYKAAFGGWSAWQNTLIRAAPPDADGAMYGAARSARIGDYWQRGGRWSWVGLGAMLVGLGLGTTLPPFAVQLAMGAAGMAAGGAVDYAGGCACVTIVV